MFAASASGSMMPPFYVYPDPPPKGVNPLNCSLPGGYVAYTEKGWMNFETFEKCLDHFSKHVITEKPVVLLIDSVGSHINRSIFAKALANGIELYRIVPNATHLMQPLDVGVFGPLKKQWYSTVRKHNRENPGVVINKINFAEKLKDCYNSFFKPITIVSSFRSSGIYPVDRNVISDEQLKTNLTFTIESDKPENNQLDSSASNGNVTRPSTDEESSALQLLAYVAASSRLNEVSVSDSSMSVVSPVMKEKLQLPKSSTVKVKRKSTLDELPDHLTAPECIRTLENKNLDKIRKFAQREKKAKQTYLKNLSRNVTVSSKSQGNAAVKGRSALNVRKGKAGMSSKGKEAKTNIEQDSLTDNDAVCCVCHMTWTEDLTLLLGHTWIQCDICDSWVHEDCLPLGFEYDKSADKFVCHNCW